MNTQGKMIEQLLILRRRLSAPAAAKYGESSLTKVIVRNQKCSRIHRR